MFVTQGDRSEARIIKIDDGALGLKNHHLVLYTYLNITVEMKSCLLIEKLIYYRKGNQFGVTFGRCNLPI